MLDTVLGLPVHAIAVHAAVVLVPLMAVLTVLVAVLRRWRVRAAWPVVAGNVLVLVALVRRRSGGLVAGVGVLAVVAAVAATAWVVVVGHTGANAVWKDVIASTTQRGGD